MADDARAWLETLAAAWRAERAAARAEVALDRRGKTLAERVARGTALSGLRVIDEYGASRDRVRVRVSVPPTIDLDNARLAPGDPVRLWAEAPDEPGAVRAVIERRDDQGLWLVLDAAIATDRVWSLDADTPEVTFDRGDRAIARAAAALGGSDLARIRDVVALVRAPRLLAPVEWTPFDEPLDDVQRAAVSVGLRSGNLAIVIGPPGTGKTRTLVEVVRQRVARGERVLCAAPSNTAVDNLGIRLAAAGVSAVRLGHPARISPALAAHTLDALVEADGATELAREWRDRARAIRRQAAGRRGDTRELWAEARALDRDAAREGSANTERAVLARADVVLATLVGCDHPVLDDATFDQHSTFPHGNAARSGGARPFDAVIIDEATQTPDPLLLVPLARARVAVLAGDPHQLGPVVIGGPDVAAVLGTTIFERLTAADASATDAVVMLEQQHRMHEQIMTFPSRSKYGGRLRAAPAVAAHRLADLGVADDPGRPQPLWLIDTAGKDWTEQRSDDVAATSLTGMPAFPPVVADPSTFNIGHAERAAAEARRLIARGLAPTEIAIIAAYSAQARRIRQLLVAERAAGLEIGTVDGFQGREKEAVIVDLVRSNDRGEIGFLADTRRMNVALTRARRFLLVIADSATLGSHPYYAEFLSYADEINVHGSAWAED